LELTGNELTLDLLTFATEVTNPKLIVAVGTAGLVSNIVGLFLFHDHGGHSHGGGGHSHGGKSHASTKPRSHSHSHSHTEPSDRTPLLSGSSSSNAPGRINSPSGESSTVIDEEEEDEDSEIETVDAIEEELFVHPGELRANVLKKAHDAGYGATTTTQPNHKRGQSSLSSVGGENGAAAGDYHDHSHEGHGDHGAGEAASDGNMNMRGVFLHVLGDAVSRTLLSYSLWSIATDSESTFY
jgi:zinc transporter 1